MNDDGELQLDKVTPRGVSPELRERVLIAVAQQLSTGIVPSWESRIGRLVAAAVVVGVVLNLWVVRSNERHLADLAGHRPLPRRVPEKVEIAKTMKVRGTGESDQQHLVKVWQSRSTPWLYQLPDWEQLIKDLEINGKVQRREKVQKVPKKGPDRARHGDRGSFDHQCRIHFSVWQTT